MVAPTSRIVTYSPLAPPQSVVNGPICGGTLSGPAHLKAPADVVSPYARPSHTSYGLSHAANCGSRRLYTTTMPTADSGGSLTEAHAPASGVVAQSVA